jgi:hypothetical protein
MTAYAVLELIVDADSQIHESMSVIYLMIICHLKNQADQAG